MRPFRIAVDFDGTIVDHRFPEIGAFAPGALEWLQRWTENDHVSLMLWTMRSDREQEGALLTYAQQHCFNNGIRFDAINVNSGDRSWTSSPKLYAHVYIDDAAACVPLIEPASFKRPCVDWSVVGPAVQQMILGHIKAHEARNGCE
ncbi:MAG: hypothetical protein IT367_20110 [Candidatus Hydrogenedentes bacterium]|nr:hypothetical protein [Candidatus Hydrogenedentota bacterium]